MTRALWTLASILVVLTLTVPSPAMADDRAAAVALFKEGNQLRQAEKYAEALDKYRASYKLLPSFKIDYNIALTLQKMGRNADAAAAYERFLETGKGKSPKKKIRLARRKLRRLKKKLATVTVRCPVGGATVSVNGKALGATPLKRPFYLAAGPYVVSVEKDGHVPLFKKVRARSGKPLRLTFDLKTVPTKPKPVAVKPPPKPAPAVIKPPDWAESAAVKPPAKPEPAAVKPLAKPEPETPATEPAAVPPPSESQPSTAEPPRRGRIFTWIALGTAGALAVSGLVVHMHASAKYSELEDQCAPNCSDTEVDSLRTEATVSSVLFGLAGAAAVTSLVLLFVEGREKKPETPGSSVQSFHLTPVVGAGTYGIHGRITF